MYTVDDIKKIIKPIAEEHGVSKVYLFGSYARNQADSESDVDLCIERGQVRTLFQLSGFRLDVEDALKLHVDLVTSDGSDKDFLNKIHSDEVLVYG